MEDAMRERRRLDGGALIFGALLLFVGGYYLLRNTLGLELPELDGEKVWPVLVLALGVALVLRGIASRSEPAETPQR
jgi:hypothetical protein